MNIVYRNGESIPAGLNSEAWQSTTLGATTYTGEDEESNCNGWLPFGNDECDSNIALSSYGRLYNWYAVNDVRALCPGGWHVPSDDEWAEFVDNLGGLNEGSAMKATFGWGEGGNGSNSSGFSALPGGWRFYLGNYSNHGYSCNLWSSSPSNTSPYPGDAFSVFLPFSNSTITLGGELNPRNGCSVRCIRDAE